MTEKKKCFVIMPFGKKKDAEGNEIDFDLVYRELIQEPIQHAGLECIRCDEIEEAGSIHEDMFEQIATAEVAVVDLTNLNANVFYELGARHALHDSVTVLIRKQGGAIPFNIQDLRVIEYSDERNFRESREKIQAFIESGLRSGAVDSPIRPILKRVREANDRTRRIEGRQAHPYLLRANPAKRIEIRTGAIENWRGGVDVWVNSENTNMQMARFYDNNLSAVIRYAGAEKNDNGEIIADTIADELLVQMNGRRSVDPGIVFATSSGALADTHKVKRVFHVAGVTGTPGGGYRSAADIVDKCVNRCLRRMDSDAMQEDDLKTIAFPMIGTGAGGGDVNEVASILIETVSTYLEEHPDSRIETVIFMAWNQRDLDACTRALSRSSRVLSAPI